MATNLWARFRKMLPGSRMVVVTVVTVNNDGTSTVTTSSGGAMRVLGTGVEATKKAYVKDGAIVSEAPNLQHYEIEV